MTTPDEIDCTAAGTAAVPRARVAEIDRSLDFYLRLGCDVRQAADGWVLLSSGPCSFVLLAAHGPVAAADPTEPTTGEAPWLRLSTPNVRALRRRLLADGVPTGAPRWSAHRSTREIMVVDPDLRSVVVEQSGSARRTRAPRVVEPVATSADARERPYRPL